MSVRQIATLLDYLEEHPEIAVGRCTRTKEGRDMAKRLWHECATILNHVATDCIQKTPNQWRGFYTEFKHKLVKKIKHAQNEQVAAGGPPSTSIPLTPLQERLYNILGCDVGEPLSEVCTNSFPVKTELSGSDTATEFSSFQASSESSGFQSPGPAPRRRRRWRQEVTEPVMSQHRANAIAQATREQAQATNRLAAALEAISERLKEPIRIILEHRQVNAQNHEGNTEPNNRE